MLFVHGYLGHTHWWDHVAPFFTQRWRAVAIDLGGMGESGRREFYSHDLCAREIVAVIEDADMAPVVLVAHSYGGVPAALACLSRPDLISRLVLLDSRLPLPGILPYRRRDTFVMRSYPDAASAIAQFRLWPPGLRPDPFVLDHIARHSFRLTPRGWESRADGATGALFASPIPSIDVARLTLPIDYILGDSSEIVSAEQGNIMLAQLPNAAGPIVLPHCHHHLMIEQPIALITALRAILAYPRDSLGKAMP